MRTELISFSATDGFHLDGAFYTPDVDSGKGAVLLVHGKTGNFYTGPSRLLPPHLTALGLSCLAMNRRGHDLGASRKSRVFYGGAWERFKDSQLDIEGALVELQRRGYPTVVLIGYSFGGLTSAAYAADHPGEIRALGLISAVSGGPEYLPRASARGILAGDRYAEVDAEARRLVREGLGDQILVLPGWWYVITASSWVDLAEGVPDTVANAGRYPGPVLALRGSMEDPHAYPAEQVAAAAGTRARLVIVPGADHFYNGTEAELAAAVCDWLKTLK